MKEYKIEEHLDQFRSDAPEHREVKDLAEEGSELSIISGCASGPHVRSGLHVGISEIYVKKGATLTFTMVHDWAEEMAVRPRTVVVVEEGGKYISNYICLKPAKDLQTYPTVYLNGDRSVATFNTVLMAIPELEARHKDLEMSHEAAVGKINQEETEYLMARGLSEAEAQSLIIKGFLSLDILGLPESLRKDVDKMVEESAGAM